MSRISRLKIAGRLASLIASGISLLALCGWLFGQPRLTDFINGFATMKPNTALGLLFVATSLWLWSVLGMKSRTLTLVLAGISTLIGAASFSEYVTGVDLHIDQLLIEMKGTGAEAVYPGRMSLATSIEFLVVGSSLILLLVRKFVISQLLAVIGLLFALFTLVGHLYDVYSLYKIGAFSSLALPTAVSFLLLAISIICAAPGEGLMSTFVSDSAGGVMARRLIPAAFLVPIMVGWGRLVGEKAGYYDAAMGVDLFAILDMAIFLVLIFLSAMVLNWSDSQRAQQSKVLRETQARLKSTIVAGSIGTWSWDPSTNLVVVDALTANLFSIDPTLVEGGIATELWLDRIDRRDKESVHSALKGAIASSASYDTVYRVNQDDGGQRWLQARGRVETDPHGRATHLHGAVMDITDRKLAERQIRATNQQLEKTLSELQTRNEEIAKMTQQLWQASKLATMGELAASIAHELNNPLATMALRTELLTEQMPTDDARQHSVTIIAEEIDRMAGLVGNLVQFSRRSHPQICSLDLRKELMNAIDLIHYHLRSAGIEIVQDFAESLPLVQGDRQQLRQVFINLFTNAADSMPEGGTLTLRTRFEEANGHAAAVTVEIADTGTGIPSDNLKKVWEPFFTTKPEGKGTGLGLPICRRTVEEHHGAIETQSNPQSGTSIKIILPAIDAAYEE